MKTNRSNNKQTESCAVRLSRIKKRNRRRALENNRNADTHIIKASPLKHYKNKMDKIANSIHNYTIRIMSLFFIPRSVVSIPVSVDEYVDIKATDEPVCLTDYLNSNSHDKLSENPRSDSPISENSTSENSTSENSTSENSTSEKFIFHLHSEDGPAQSPPESNYPHTTGGVVPPPINYQEILDSFDRQMAQVIAIPKEHMGKQTSALDLEMAAKSMRKIMDGMATS